MSILKLKDKNGNWVSIPTIKGDPGEQGVPGKDANVTKENIERALGFTPASEKSVTDVDHAKLDKPETAPTVGKVLKVKSVNPDGSFVCEWADDANDGSVTDVQVNGTSAVVDGVADIPVGSATKLGVYKVYPNYGISTYDNTLTIQPAERRHIDARAGGNRPLIMSELVYGVDSVLCSTAESEKLTDEQKQAAQERIGVTEELEKKANTEDVYTKTESDEKFADKNIYQQKGIVLTPSGPIEGINPNNQVILAQDSYGETNINGVHQLLIGGDMTSYGGYNVLVSNIVATTQSSYNSRPAYIKPYFKLCDDGKYRIFPQVGTSESSNGCVALGSGVKALGAVSFAHGNGCIANGNVSFAHGQNVVVDGVMAGAIGEGLYAGQRAQFVVGKFNSNDSNTVFEVGSGSNDANRNNAFAVTSTGIAKAQTGLQIGDTAINEEQLNSLPALRTITQSAYEALENKSGIYFVVGD